MFKLKQVGTLLFAYSLLRLIKARYFCSFLWLNTSFSLVWDLYLWKLQVYLTILNKKYIMYSKKYIMYSLYQNSNLKQRFFPKQERKYIYNLYKGTELFHTGFIGLQSCNKYVFSYGLNLLEVLFSLRLRLGYLIDKSYGFINSELIKHILHILNIWNSV